MTCTINKVYKRYFVLQLMVLGVCGVSGPDVHSPVVEVGVPE